MRGLTTAAIVWMTAAIGILRDVLRHCTQAGFAIAEVTTHRLEHDIGRADAVAVELVRSGDRPRPLRRPTSPGARL